ncbi:hypothetical protein C7B76_08215 [filamentous cyanobacterium CCP2]|nr:hypothetical protein C7B76_08215 [filamentous cyanobacterium CCP2]
MLIGKEIHSSANLAESGDTMSDASFIGLGSMGLALASAVLQRGHSITVWNRTSQKAESLVQAGALLAQNVKSAVCASPVVFICVDNYETARSILGSQAARELSGRVLVQLSTGSPQDAREMEVWAHDRGANYLDGAILAYPEQIATPQSTILVSGSESAFHQAERYLKVLAPKLIYLGDQVGAASALDCATLSYLYGALLGTVHGSLICESEGISVNDYRFLLPEYSSIVSGEVAKLSQCIYENRFENPTASLKTYFVAWERIVQQAQAAQISQAFPAFISSLLDQAVSDGYGSEEFAALIKTL